MEYLMTGALGFIGMRTTTRFLETGYVALGYKSATQNNASIRAFVGWYG